MSENASRARRPRDRSWSSSELLESIPRSGVDDLRFLSRRPRRDETDGGQLRALARRCRADARGGARRRVPAPSRGSRGGDLGPHQVCVAELLRAARGRAAGPDGIRRNPARCRTGRGTIGGRRDRRNYQGKTVWASTRSTCRPSDLRDRAMPSGRAFPVQSGAGVGPYRCLRRRATSTYFSGSGPATRMMISCTRRSGNCLEACRSAAGPRHQHPCLLAARTEVGKRLTEEYGLVRRLLTGCPSLHLP